MNDTKQDTGTIDVKYVANLARLNLTDEEVSMFQGQLDGIVQYIEKIGELNLDGVEPTSRAGEVLNVFRKDEVRPSIDHDKVMENAPASVKEMFKVPKIVE